MGSAGSGDDKLSMNSLIGIRERRDGPMWVGSEEVAGGGRREAVVEATRGGGMQWGIEEETIGEPRGRYVSTRARLLRESEHRRLRAAGKSSGGLGSKALFGSLLVEEADT